MQKSNELRILPKTHMVGVSFNLDKFLELIENKNIISSDGTIEAIMVYYQRTNIFVKGWGGYTPYKRDRAYEIELEDLKKLIGSYYVQVYFVWR